MVASTISSLIPSREILGTASASDISMLVAGEGECGGVDSMGAESEESRCDRLMRLVGWESGDMEREVDVGGDIEVAGDVVDVFETDDRRPAPLAAALAAFVMGI